MSPGLADDDGQHLEPADVAALLGRDPLLEKVCRHLAAVCEPCGEQLRRVEALMKRFRHWNPEVAVAEGLVADGLLDALLATEPASWASRVEEDTELQTWGVAWVALERSRDLLAREAEGRALELALLAEKVAGYLGAVYHPEWIADLKALSHAAAAAAGPPGADSFDTLRQVAAAVTALEEGTGDPTVASDVMALLSQVLRKPASRHES
jgi:hypothetical protein